MCYSAIVLAWYLRKHTCAVVNTKPSVKLYFNIYHAVLAVAGQNYSKKSFGNRIFTRGEDTWSFEFVYSLPWFGNYKVKCGAIK